MRAALISLVALAAVIVALVLMHGMSGTHTAVAHTAAAPVATAVSSIAGPTAGHEADDRVAGALGETGSASVLHASVFLGPASTVLTEAGGAPWLWLATLCLFIVVSLALVLRVMGSRRDLSARPAPGRSAASAASALVRAIPLRLAISIDRR
ncbi:hypothetical protein [Agromyces bauzanensis]|uniref:hypothetical protein n=1 Tax=Agromyces bauzanensis TaxID=1308924 RepID=UPI001669D837|nr:hypothetical protein [Agromyces bauzanensis]